MTLFTARSRRAVVSWLILLVIVGGVAMVAAPSTAQEELGEVTGDAGSGQALYGLNCAECHGSDGRGGTDPAGREAPALVDTQAASLDYMDLTMRTGRMPPPQDAFNNSDREILLTESEQADILAYMQEAFGLERVIGEVTTGEAGDGLALYAENCASCHGATGAGGVAGAGAWTPQVTHYEPETLAMAIRVGPFEMPPFDADALTDEEVSDIAAFMEELDAEQAAVLYAGELNPVFASAFVAVLALAGVIVAVTVAGKPVRYQDPDAEVSVEALTDGAPADIREEKPEQPPEVDSIVDTADAPADRPADEPGEEEQ